MGKDKKRQSSLQLQGCLEVILEKRYKITSKLRLVAKTRCLRIFYSLSNSVGLALGLSEIGCAGLAFLPAIFPLLF